MCPTKASERLAMRCTSSPVDQRRANGVATVGRGELFIWLAFILLANQIFRIPAELLAGLAEALLPSLLSRSVFYYLGWYAVICLLFESDRKVRASAMDITFALLMAVLNFLPPLR